jgi:hypothetical protein
MIKDRSMLEIMQWSLKCSLEREDALALFRYLDSRGYKSYSWAILRQVMTLTEPSGDESDPEGYFKGSNNDNYAASQVVISDVFVRDEPRIYHLAVRKYGMFGLAAPKQTVASIALVATVVQPTDEASAGTEEFLSAVVAFLKGAGKLSADDGFEEITGSSTCNEALDELPELEALSSFPTATELTAALTLSDAETRRLVLNIKTKEIAYLRDYVGRKGGKTDPRTTKETLGDLVKKGLLENGVAATCKKASTAFLTGTKEEIEQSQGRCPKCGSLPRDENLAEIVRGTALSDSLVLKNRWMLVLTVTTLRLLGVPASDIRVPPPDAGSDPLDVAFCMDNRLFLMELKDGNFEAHHAATFGARLKQAENVDEGLVACTGTVADEARKLLESLLSSSTQPMFTLRRSSNQRCEFLDGSTAMTARLASVLRSWRAVRAAAFLELEGIGAGLNSLALLYRKL